MKIEKNICEKINSRFPDLGECNKDFDVDYNFEVKSFEIALNKDGKRLKTYVEPNDAYSCLFNDQCIGLSFQMAELKDNIQRL